MSKAPKKIYVKEFDEGISRTWSSTKAQKTTAIIQHEYIRKDAATEALSLPANLDSAANNYGVDVRFGYPRVMDETDRYIYNAFKAGAKWMAEQGETLESLIWRDEDDKLFIEAFVDENKFKMADNVTIQVRKKQ